MLVNSPSENLVITICILTSDTGEIVCSRTGDKFFDDWLKAKEEDTKTNYSVFYQNIVVQIPKPVEKPKVKVRLARIDKMFEVSGESANLALSSYFKNMKIDYEDRQDLGLYQGITEDGTIFHYDVMEPKRDASKNT